MTPPLHASPSRLGMTHLQPPTRVTRRPIPQLVHASPFSLNRDNCLVEFLAPRGQGLSATIQVPREALIGSWRSLKR